LDGRDDVFVPALITDVSLREMAETFDAIKAMALELICHQMACLGHGLN